MAVNQSEDWALIDMLTDFEADPHTMVASELHNIPPYKVSSKTRKKTKSANFGIIYGMKPKALATSIFGVDSPSDEQIAEATDLYNLYCYKRAVMLKELEDAKNFVRDNGWLENKLHYKMVYEQIIDIKDYLEQVFTRVTREESYPDEFVPKPKIDFERKRKFLGQLLNACGNYPIQSWAGGILMSVYVALRRLLIEAGYKDSVTIPLQVHDEVGVAFLKKEVHPYQLIKLQNEALVSKLEYLHKPKVAPLYIGIGFGTSWGEAKGDNEELPVDLQRIMIEEYERGEAPSIEEILSEGVHKHFMRRIEEYVADRVRQLFQDMMDNKHFVRQEMQHRLNHNMFVGKKTNELFGTNDANGEIMMSEYLRLIYNLGETEESKEIKKRHKGIIKGILDNPKSGDLQKANRDRNVELLNNLESKFMELGITYEEGEPIQEEGEKVVTPDEIVDFFFVQEVHPLVKVSEDTITVDLRQVYTPIAIKVREYITSLQNREYNIHNKAILYLYPTKNEFAPEKILGIPGNFSEVMDKILAGESITISTNNDGTPHVSFAKIPVKFTDKGIIIDCNECNEISPLLLNEVCAVVMKYTSTAQVATIPVLVQGNTLVDSGLKVIGIPVNLQDEIEELVRRFLNGR